MYKCIVYGIYESSANVKQECNIQPTPVMACLQTIKLFTFHLKLRRFNTNHDVEMVLLYSVYVCVVEYNNNER